MLKWLLVDDSNSTNVPLIGCIYDFKNNTAESYYRRYNR